MHLENLRPAAGNGQARGSASSVVSHRTQRNATGNLLDKWKMMDPIIRQYHEATVIRVAFRLLDHRNRQTGRCDPSMGRIAADLGIDRRTVIRAINQLEQDGYIVKTSGKQGRTSNQYEFNWHRLTGDSDVTHSDGTGDSGDTRVVGQMSLGGDSDVTVGGDSDVTLNNESETVNRNTESETAADAAKASDEEESTTPTACQPNQEGDMSQTTIQYPDTTLTPDIIIGNAIAAHHAAPGGSGRALWLRVPAGPRAKLAADLRAGRLTVETVESAVAQHTGIVAAEALAFEAEWAEAQAAGMDDAERARLRAAYVKVWRMH